MNLVDNYTATYGYDYYDNAAEDTLVFFVKDENAPFAATLDSISQMTESDSKQTETKQSKNLKK